MEKSPEAFRTISEVADWLDTPAHVLRFWESRFSQIKPVKRAGGRRYYRPSDMLLLGGIKKLLHEDGMTIRGVQKILREQGVRHVSALSAPVNGGEVIDAEASEAPMAEDVVPEPEDNVVALNDTRHTAPAPPPEDAPDTPPPDTAPPPEPSPDTAPAPESAQEPDGATQAADAAPGPDAGAPPDEGPEPGVEAPADATAASPGPESEMPPPPTPLGAGLLATDPEDDDPAFAPIVSPMTTLLRRPAARAALGALPADRLATLEERLSALHDRLMRPDGDEKR
ncbi:DNA-binding transcriptional MerR regulator [Rhodovulum iodosum]|uniref:DNA-binding transcriptional MerR regulator n=1 Tax=Rhodovulum iodosum TaxID=68291 RepID=A0ABV3XT01_9RHOB|nr:MerR family transcriptional regulator [Rhodovulum robiginosum]RSK39032.1 MerR family transcriptional regulator [Rhodovulum robiginosum]